MHRHTAVVAVLACMAMLVAAYIFLAGPENAQAPSGPVTCTLEARQCPDGTYVGRSGSRCEFAPCPRESAQVPAPRPSVAWAFTSDGEYSSIPYTRVHIHAAGDVYDAGSYAGSCNELDHVGLATGELSGALCWYAGGGVELGVFTGRVHPILRAREVEEGTAETPAIPGVWHDLLELK